VKYRINRWTASYRISKEQMDYFESFALSLGLKMDVRYTYAQRPAEWKNLDRIFFYDGEKRGVGNTRAKIIRKENGEYELVIFDKEIDERWKAHSGKNK